MDDGPGPVRRGVRSWRRAGVAEATRGLQGGPRVGRVADRPWRAADCGERALRRQRAAGAGSGHGRCALAGAPQSEVQYSTPCIYERPGRRPEVIFTNWENGITGVELQTGRVSWERRVFDESHIECSISSPIVAGDLILGTCGYLGHGEQTVAVRPDDAQPDAVTKVYRVERGAPLTPTPLVANGLLFLWADDGIVTCVDARTGEPVWRQRVGGTYYGSPVAVGEAVYCVSADGEMVVIAARREFEVLGRTPLGEVSHATPAVANGVMYVRTVTRVMAVGGPHRE